MSKQVQDAYIVAATRTPIGHPFVSRSWVAGPFSSGHASLASMIPSPSVSAGQPFF